MALVKCGADVSINPDHVVSIVWDRGHSYTAMVVATVDGNAIRLKHQPSAYGGTDCYAIEAALIEAANAAARAPGPPPDES